ncbi:MAG: radical SAM protein, partial [Candidatus Muiribacteriaceae bacterium]
LTHAWNVDLKGFTDDFYQKMCCGNLSSVLRTIKTLAESSVHLEITNLLIPGENDDIGIFRKMVEWIADIDRSIPLHISGYYPANQCRNPSTHISEINKFTGIAREYLEYVYAGNTGEPCTTYCPECETRLTLRQHYYINNSTINGKCPECGHSIYVED